MYSMSFKDVAIVAAQDFFELDAPTVGVGILHAVYLSQTSDVGDAAEEILTVEINTGATTVGSVGGGAGVEVPMTLGDAAATAVGWINFTTEASAGTIVAKHTDAFNVRVGWQYIPPPEQRITWSANFLAVALITIPADSLTMSGTIIWEELD